MDVIEEDTFLFIIPEPPFSTRTLIEDLLVLLRTILYVPPPVPAL
jgi:hypothetical protein